MSKAIDLLDKLKKNCRIDEADILADTKFFKEREAVPTPVPMVNVAISGRVDGGIQPGSYILAGDSKTFKCLDGDTPITVYIP